MKKLTRNLYERFILLFIFILLTFLNLDFYFTILNIFFILELIFSFCIRIKIEKSINKKTYFYSLFIIIYYIILAFSIPEFFEHLYLVCCSFIGVFIVMIYFIPCEDEKNKYTKEMNFFYLINIASIFSTYNLVGFNQYLLLWFILLIVFNIFCNKIYLIRASVFMILMIIILLSTNKIINNLSLILPDLDTGSTSIGSNDARVTLKNKIIFSGEGQLPNNPLFYDNRRNVLTDFNNEKIEWKDISLMRYDYNMLNIVRNIESKNKSIGQVYPFNEDYYYNFYYYKDNYERMMLSPQFMYFKFYYQNFDNESFLKHMGFINFFDNLKGDITIKELSFKPNFLRKQAIPIKKVLVLNTPMNILEYMPPNVISIKSKDKNKIEYATLGEDLLVISKEKRYKKLKITYLDSIYISYRSPVREDTYISEKYKKMIDIISPEIGIKNTDDVYTKENKIHNWFNKNFKYTEKLKYNGKSRSIEDFLLRDRRGHCEYFATATALISRYYGIPTQYITGIMINKSKDNFYGNMKFSHAWDLFWDGAGWIRIDNTATVLDNETPLWMHNLYLNLNWKSIKEIFNLKENKLLLSFNNLFIILITFSVILFVLILFISILKIRNKNKYKDKILEKKLKRSLRFYLKKYPKEKYIPWKTWATSTGEDFCIQKVKEYYDLVYS